MLPIQKYCVVVVALNFAVVPIQLHEEKLPLLALLRP